MLIIKLFQDVNQCEYFSLPLLILSISSFFLWFLFIFPCFCLFSFLAFFLSSSPFRCFLYLSRSLLLSNICRWIINKQWIILIVVQYDHNTFILIGEASIVYIDYIHIFILICSSMYFLGEVLKEWVEISWMLSCLVQ